jgi:UDP-N-acetylglucosamine 2-epimerase (non-hydrolysing)
LRGHGSLCHRHPARAIKWRPIINELPLSQTIRSVVCATAQHRELLDSVLGLFDITPDYDLDLMR